MDTNSDSTFQVEESWRGMSRATTPYNYHNIKGKGLQGMRRDILSFFKESGKLLGQIIFCIGLVSVLFTLVMRWF